MVEISRRKLGQTGGRMTEAPELPVLSLAIARAAIIIVLKYSLCHVEMATGLTLRGKR